MKYKVKNRKRKDIVIITVIIVLFISGLFLKNYDIEIRPVTFLKDIGLKFINILNPDEDKNSCEVYETRQLSLERELEELKEELELKNILTDYKAIPATVILRDNMDYQNHLTIDKGTNDDLEKDMIVITSRGLVGKIDSLTSHTATVRLITTNSADYKLSVYVLTKEGECHGLISGYDHNKGLIIVTSIANSCKLNTNAKIITSGLGTNYPKGILVGYIDNKESDTYQTSQIAYVKSKQSFEKITYVTVLQK